MSLPRWPGRPFTLFRRPCRLLWFRILSAASVLTTAAIASQSLTPAPKGALCAACDLPAILARTLPPRVYEPWETEIAKILEHQRVSLRFQDAPLREVIRAVHEQTGLNLTLDEAINADETRVWLSLNSAPLGAAIEQILAQAELRRDTVHGTLRFSPSPYEEAFCLEISDVSDLVAAGLGDCGQIREFLIDTTGEELWKSSGSIQTRRGHLLVHHRSELHDAIARILEQLRREQGLETPGREEAARGRARALRSRLASIPEEERTERVLRFLREEVDAATWPIAIRLPPSERLARRHRPESHRLIALIIEALVASDPAGQEPPEILEERRIDLALDRQPFCEAIELLAEASGLSFVISNSARSEVENDGARVSLNLRAISVKHALLLMLEASGALTYGIKEGAVLITTRDEAGRPLILERYEVSDLLQPPPPYPAWRHPFPKANAPPTDPGVLEFDTEVDLDLEPRISGETLIELAEKVCAEEDEGSLELSGGILVARKSPARHREIARLLQALRRQLQKASSSRTSCSPSSR